MYVCMYLYMYVCVYVYMYVCMYVCMCTLLAPEQLDGFFTIRGIQDCIRHRTVPTGYEYFGSSNWGPSRGLKNSNWRFSRKRLYFHYQ
jgi:hypothetical protein